MGKYLIAFAETFIQVTGFIAILYGVWFVAAVLG
jgi:hypothetical protein